MEKKVNQKINENNTKSIALNKLIPKKKFNPTNKGKNEETCAVKWLQKRGIRILETNWRCNHCEVDIIGIDGQVVVFYEVKFRKKKKSFHIFPIIPKSKQNRLLYAANMYISKNNINAPYRFDLIYITTTSKNEKKILLIRDAFSAIP